MSFKHLCLPPSKGGVGLIDPVKQYLVLQMKWLLQLFFPEFSSCKKSLLHHMSIMQAVSDKPLLPFFVPEFRHDPLCHTTSIIPTMYKTIDHFGIQFEFDELPLSTLLLCPLQYMFEDLPAKHWLYRYKTIPISSFLDARLDPGRLTVRIPRTYPAYLSLLAGLYRDVFYHKTIKFRPFMLSYLGGNLPPSDSPPLNCPLEKQLRQHQL
ncbi:hypothetical protein BD560DRAFT_340980 [Blakeslea trispora]|nr:hypothetical protein BD560DRAFT_340980 [Blakeslea trispora]